MCYNLKEGAARKCKVNINSSIGGSGNSVCADGYLEASEDKFTVSYALDGDKCTLSYCDNTAEQIRVGGQNVKITFKEGEKTFCEIGTGAFHGGFEVYTKTLKLISGKGGVKLTLEYFSGTDGEKNALSFVAAYTEQEKK